MHPKEKGAVAADPHSDKHRWILTPSETRCEALTSGSIPSLHNEFEAAMEGFKGYQELQLIKAGIDPSVISKLPFRKVGFIRAWTESGRFQPDYISYPLFIIATGITTGGGIEDLVGFHPEIPRQWWLRTGEGYCLGDPHSPLIHVDITRFLMDGAQGCVPLANNHG